MRTQKSAHSLRSINIVRSPSPYICPSCRCNASRSSSHATASASYKAVEKVQKSRSVAIAPAGQDFNRCLRNGRRRSQSTEASPSNLNGNIDSIVPAKDGTALKSGDEGSIGESKNSALAHGVASSYASRSNIRSRLKLWSEEQSQLANASGTATSDFTALPIPNSLLIEDLNELEGDREIEMFDMQEEAVDEEDDNLFASNALCLEPGDVFRTNL